MKAAVGGAHSSEIEKCEQPTSCGCQQKTQIAVGAVGLAQQSVEVQFCHCHCKQFSNVAENYLYQTINHLLTGSSFCQVVNTVD